MERFTWKECERQDKKDNFKRNVKEKLHDAKDWVSCHKTELFAFGVLGVMGMRELNKAATHKERRIERNKQERMIYDPSIRDWWELKKPLTNEERVEYESRVNNGEDRGKVLYSMKKLK